MRKILYFMNNLPKLARKTNCILFPVVLATVLLASRPAVPEESAAFLVRDSGVSFAVETYKERDGWTPLVLSAAHLEVRLWMNRQGRVSELRRSSLPAVFTIDLESRRLLVNGQALPFEIYEHNRVRSRLRLLEKDKPLRFIVDRRGKGLDLCLGGSKFRLNLVRAEAAPPTDEGPGCRMPGQVAPIGCLSNKLPGNRSKEEAAPGIKELVIHGAAVRIPQRYLFRQGKKNTYTQYCPESREIPPLKPAAVPAAEREALIALYDSTNGDNWTNNSGWKDGSLEPDGFGPAGSENSWYGIACNTGNTTVERINLRNNNLTGTIPAALENLTHLQYLNLSGNQLTGGIPAALGNLSDLGSLILNSNQLTGAIPAALGGLTNLGSLILSSNQLTGAIPRQLGSLARLGNLLLDSNQLTGNIPVELGNLANLTSLWLNSNRLSGYIPVRLGNLNSLVYLYLSENQLQGPIPVELGNLTRLVSLLLDFNRLTGEIPRELEHLNNLVYLNLNSNHLTGDIPPRIRNLENLTLLQMQHNSLQDRIPPIFENLDNLQYLYLNSNKFKDEVPPNMAELGNLIDLDIGYNALFSENDELRNFLGNRDPDWESTQTISPLNQAARTLSGSSILLTWTPIRYTADTGHYRVIYSKKIDGPYLLYGLTADKTVSQLTVSGLQKNTTYYFKVKARTEPHTHNQNIVVGIMIDPVSAKTASVTGVSISGTIKNPDGKGVSGVTLSFSPLAGTVKTDSSGRYSHEVLNGWTGVAKPVKTGCYFFPSGRIYTNIAVNKGQQNYTAIQNMVRAFQVERLLENSWIIKKYYANIAVTMDYGKYAHRFIIYRKQQDGEYRALHEFFPDDLLDGNYTYSDRFLDNTPYTYKVEAVDSAGTVIDASEEKTI